MANVLFDAYQLRTFYAVDGLTHRNNMWLEPFDFDEAPGQDFDQYAIVDELSNSSPLDDFSDNFVDLFSNYLHPDHEVVSCELWKVEADSSNFVFLSSKSYGIDGQSSSTFDDTAIEAIHTARTNLGRILKFVIEEPQFEVAIPQTWVANPAGLAAAQMGAELLAPSTFVRDREGGHPIALLRVFIGTNEAIFKKRFR